MAKHRSGSNKSQVLGQKTLSVQLPLPVLGVVVGAREAFQQLLAQFAGQPIDVVRIKDRVMQSDVGAETVSHHV